MSVKISLICGINTNRELDSSKISIKKWKAYKKKKKTVPGVEIWKTNFKFAL